MRRVRASGLATSAIAGHPEVPWVTVVRALIMFGHRILVEREADSCAEFANPKPVTYSPLADAAMFPTRRRRSFHVVYPEGRRWATGLFLPTRLRRSGLHLGKLLSLLVLRHNRDCSSEEDLLRRIDDIRL
jgi:hypothetical protein